MNRLWHSIADRRRRVISGPLPARTDHTAPSTNRDAGTVTHTQRWEIDEHVASINAIPRSILPDGAARVQLVALAANGFDVYAYAAGVDQRWYVWLGPLADVIANRDGRVTISDWNIRFETIVHFMLAARPGGAA